VTFVTNGGSEVSAQTTSVIKTVPRTTKENYLFDGWYLDEDFKALAVFPLSVEYDTTLYAKWLKIYDTAACKNYTISGKQDFSSSVSYDVSPSNFDFSALDERNMLLKITVTYKIKYNKSYNVPLDIGYMGSPKYEVYLLGEDLKGASKENLSTTTSAQSRSIEMCTSASYFENNTIKLTFSTDNIQNTIYISDIEITYECGKQSE
jgi:uncharacterized repeat protein (TIGR02543 family)